MKLILLALAFVAQLASSQLCSSVFGTNSVANPTTTVVTTITETSSAIDHETIYLTGVYIGTTSMTYTTLVGDTTITVPTVSGSTGLVPIISAPTDHPTGTPRDVGKAGAKSSTAPKSSRRSSSKKADSTLKTSTVKASPSPTRMTAHITSTAHHAQFAADLTTYYLQSVVCTDYSSTLILYSTTTTTWYDLQTTIYTEETHTTSRVATVTAYAACEPAAGNLISSYKGTPINAVGGPDISADVCSSGGATAGIVCATPQQCCAYLQELGSAGGFVWTANATQIGGSGATGIACLDPFEFWFDIGDAPPDGPIYIGNAYGQKYAPDYTGGTWGDGSGP